MSTEGQRELRAIGDLARAEIRGEVDKEVHDRGRERAIAAFVERGRSRRPIHDRAASGPKPRAGRAGPIGVWLAAAAMACAIIAIAIAWPRAPLALTVDGAVATAGAYVHARPGGSGAIVRFGDGSEIAFAPGSSGRVAEVSPRGARVQLESGKASVRVAHLPAARWSIEAGPFVIAVIGTRFDVAWSSEDQALDVRLHEGAIAVRGPLAPSGIEMRAGQHLVARLLEGEVRIDDGTAQAAIKAPSEPTAIAPPPSATAAPSAVPAASTTSVVPETSARPSPRARTWTERVADGDFRGVLADAEARGIDRSAKSAPLADLVALADAARYAGRSDVARRALMAERDRFPSTAEARAAAFLLGRLADDGGGAPAEALRWYDAYLAEAPRGAFAAEALGRKMMALRRAGDFGARAVAAEYLRLHPRGAHAAAAREIAEP